jgi:hypothetical protein
VEGVNKLEDRALIGGRGLFDLSEPLEEPGGFRCGLVGSGLEPERLV